MLSNPRFRALSVSAALITAWLANLSAGPAHAAIHTFSFALQGSQEVPPNASPGTGQCTVTVDDVQRTVDVSCTYSGLSAASTAAHIHQGASGTNGPPFVTLSHSSAPSGTITGFSPLLPAQLQALLSGNAYINVHSTAFPDGEIRGQIENPPPQQSLYAMGLEHTALGAATLTARDLDDDGYPRAVIIDHLGSSGHDGVQLRLGTANGGVERPGVQGCFVTIQHMPGTALLPIQPRNVIKSLFQTGDAPTPPTQDQLSINYSHKGADGEVFFTPSPDLELQSLSITLRHDGDAVYSTTVPFAPVEALVSGPIAEVEFMDTAILIELLIYPEFDIAPIAMEKELRFGTARMLSVLGAPPVLADHIQIEPTYLTDDPRVKFIRMELSAASNGPVHLSQEGVIHRDIACRALGNAHIAGSEECSTGVCADALIVDNLGSSGQDGVSCRIIQDRDTGRSKGFEISFLPIELGAGERLTIGSEWCPSSPGPGDDDDCDSPVSIWCALEGAAAGATIDADFSGAGVTAAKAYARKNGAIVAADFDYHEASIAPTPRSAVQVVSATDSDHVTGQYMAGFVWKFAGDVQLEVPGQPPVLIDELQVVTATPIKKEEGGRHTPFHNRWQPGGIGHAIVIKEVKPANVTFTSGHVFGFHHTASDGAVMAIGFPGPMAPPMPNVPTPLTVSIPGSGGGGGGSGGSVTTEIGQAMQYMRATIQANPPQMVRITGIPPGSQAAGGGEFGEARVGDCPNPNDPLCQGAPPMGSGGYFAVDYSNVGISQYEIEFVTDGQTIQSLMLNEPPIFDYAQDSGIDVYFNPKEITIDKAIPWGGGGGGGGHAMGVSLNRGPGTFSTFVLRNNGMAVDAHEVRVKSAGPVPKLDAMGAVRWSSGNPTFPSRFAITDEAMGMFDADHRATGTARLYAAPNGHDPLTRPARMTNPSPGTVSGIYSEKASYGGITGIGHPNYRMSILVPDPCAGLPPDCIGWPNDAKLFWETLVYGDDPFTVDTEPPVALSLTSSFVTGQGEPSHVSVELDPSQLGVTTCHLQMYLDGQLIDDVPDYSGPLQVSGDGGNNLNWPFGASSIVGDASIQFTATFSDGRYILRSGASPLTPVECDEVRFTVHPSKLMLRGIKSAAIATRDIEVVDMTDLEFGFDPQPPCPADIAPAPNGNGVVNVQDLLAVISAWGACPDPSNCPADIAPPGGNDIVNVSDLLAVIGAWGACP